MDRNFILRTEIILKKVKKIAEWDPYTLPVIAETSGNCKLYGFS